MDVGVSRPTVGKWRSRFVERRLDGLLDEPRPGAPRTVDDEKVEQVVTEPICFEAWARASKVRFVR